MSNLPRPPEYAREYGLVLVPPPRRGQTFSKNPDHIGSQRNESRFVGLGPADGDHAVVEVHVSQALPQRFPDPAAYTFRRGTTAGKAPDGSRYMERMSARSWELQAALEQNSAFCGTAST